MAGIIPSQYHTGATPMQTRVLISFIADDRPGIVRGIAEVVAAHGGNWLESRMTYLGGKFAGIISVELPQAGVGELREALGALDALGLVLRVEVAQEQSTTTVLTPWQLEIIGPDRMGIVHEFAAALASRQINVVKMRSDITSAPMSADMLFTASALIHVPAAIDIDELREQLDEIAEELTIDYSLVDATG